LEADQLALKAIFSRSLKSAQATAELITKDGVTPDLYSDDAGTGKALDDLFARDDIKGVIIALTITTQPKYIEAALAAGKHVLAEKPIAADVAGAKKLLEYYGKIGPEKSVTFGIAENFRFIPKYAYARSEIEKLGKVTGFNVIINGFQAKGT